MLSPVCGTWYQNLYFENFFKNIFNFTFKFQFKIHTTKTDIGECDKLETSTFILVKFATILAKLFSKKKTKNKKQNKENQAKLYKNKKLDKGRKLWYLLFSNFWSLLPKFLYGGETGGRAVPPPNLEICVRS